MLHTLKVPSAGSWGFYVVIQRACALEAGEEKTAWEFPLQQPKSPLYCQEPRGIHMGGETLYIRLGLSGRTHYSQWKQLGGQKNPERYFYFMQFHFCLDLSDPLILRGTLFPCDVKTPGLKILFLLSFQEL